MAGAMIFLCTRKIYGKLMGNLKIVLEGRKLYGNAEF